MQKRIILIFFILICFAVFILPMYANDISAKSAVLIEAQSGAVAYGKNQDLRLPMASTTKIMTALVVLEKAELDEIITVTPEMTGIEGSSIYLRAGEELTVEELLYALLLESANDAAVALAMTVGETVEGFAQMMNEKSREIGLTDTHFTNPHGLDSDEHYTTAYELGLISACAMKNPSFERIVSTYKKTIPLNNGEGARVLVNHNRLLRSYDGAIGIKTGFTKKCGRCLVSSATRDGVTLICVTLNAPNDWQDHKNMLDYGFSRYESVSLASPNSYNVELNAIGGEKSTFIAGNNDGLRITLERKKHNISAVLEANRLISAPVQKGDLVAKIVFYNDGELIGSLPLYARESVKELNYKKSFFERLFNNGKNKTAKILYRQQNNVKA